MVSLPFIWKPFSLRICVIFIRQAESNCILVYSAILVGNLERLRPEEHDALAVVIEWSDLDTRLGLRTLGGWQVEKLADIVDSVSQSLERLMRALQRISSTLPTVRLYAYASPSSAFLYRHTTK